MRPYAKPELQTETPVSIHGSFLSNLMRNGPQLRTMTTTSRNTPMSRQFSPLKYQQSNHHHLQLNQMCVHQHPPSHPLLLLPSSSPKLTTQLLHPNPCIWKTRQCQLQSLSSYLARTRFTRNCLPNSTRQWRRWRACGY